MYIKGRQIHNPKYFDQLREKLLAALHDYPLPGVATDPKFLFEAVELLLQSQRAQLGFLANRQTYKATVLGELGLQLSDALSNTREGLLFWRILARANLGFTYFRLRRHNNARDVLREGMELAEVSSGATSRTGRTSTPNQAVSAAENVLAAACAAYLVQLELEVGEVDAAWTHWLVQVQVFERFLWDLAKTSEDVEVVCIVVADAHTLRGYWDEKLTDYQAAGNWFTRAKEILERHLDIGDDHAQLLSQVEEDIRRVRVLQACS